MEGFFKWFFIGHFLILIIVGCISSYMGLSPPAILVGVMVSFECFIYVLERKYIPKRKTELANKLIRIFKAEPFSEGVMKFKINTIDLFAVVVVDFKLGFQFAHVETVRFHIPRTQIKLLATKPGFELIEDKIDGIQTYYVYQTNGSGLKLAKEKIEKMI